MISGLFVSNASPLIALERIQRLDLFPSLFARVLVPPAVRREIGGRLAEQVWIVERSLTRPIESRIVVEELGAGESEALALARELRGSQIVLADEPARQLALELGVPLLGTLGIVLIAERRGVIPLAKPVLNALVDTRFRVDPAFSNACSLWQANDGEVTGPQEGS